DSQGPVFEGFGSLDDAVAAIRQGAGQSPIDGYLPGLAAGAFGLSIEMVHDDVVNGDAASISEPMGPDGGDPVWLININFNAGLFIGAEKVVHGSDLVQALTVEASVRVRQPGTTRSADALTQPWRWGPGYRGKGKAVANRSNIDSRLKVLP